MVDITHKIKSLRVAVAEAYVKVGSPATINAIKNHTVPKGDVLEMSKAAGFFAIKNTHNAIPDCHPLPVEFASVHYKLEEELIKIIFEVKTVYKTGVEVEAMHGASIVALTIYDMLKPIDKKIEIQRIRLLEKQGGKSTYNKNSTRVKASVVVCSDSISEGKKEDRAGKTIIKNLKENGVGVASYDIIPDEIERIRNKALEHVKSNNLVIFTGGTGFSFRDVTPEALEPILERRIPGIEESIRSYGQERTPYAMLSRSVAGTIGNTLILALPGSTKGAGESMQALFPQILHLFKILRGANHDDNA